MSYDDLIGELLHEVLESDRTPEDVCARHPELLADLRTRLRKLRAVQAQVDSLFPLSAAATQAFDDSASQFAVELPNIPGYAVQAVLGRGGMGIVYKARHLKLHRDVALKSLRTGPYASRQECLRFVREAESVAALQHPNIVQVYDIGEVDGHPYFTMELVDGGSLAERLAGTAQPAREAAELLSILARAVQVAHASGIVHRDLKPANILLADAGMPKISDFGLARRLDQESGLTMTGARLGTPSYMAPEQMVGHSAAVGPAVDVFALGAILYEMLTGRPPFRGETISETERRLASEEPERPSQLNPKVPRDLETICLKCLEKEPRNRYASAGALAADIERFLRHEPIQARPIAPAERWVRWVRRNPLLTALGVTSLFVLVLIASQVWQLGSRQAAARAEKTRLTARFESGVQLVQAGRFAEARAILGKLGDGGFTDLRRRIDRAVSDLTLVEKLEGIAVRRATALSAPDATWQPAAQAAREYEALFAQAGLGVPADDPGAVAKRIATSDIKEALVAALDDWAACESDESRRDWALAVARQADPSARSWASQCRELATWSDRAALARLAEPAHAAQASAQQLRAFGDRLAAAGLDAMSFRGRVQQQHVDNFLANLSLADALRAENSAESIRYYQAALAIHPRSATAHNNLAVALSSLGRTSEAIAAYERSLALDPESAAAHFNLARAFATTQSPNAILHLQRAIELDGGLAAAHRLLGELYTGQGRYDDAEKSLQRCLPLLRDEAERREVLELLRACEAQRSGQ
ncbi:MAG: protein kinase [Pirellulales bacterium]